MASRSKYKGVSSLFETGTELELPNGTAIWVQALNPFEYDDARNAAQAAKSRLVLALEEYGSDELARFQGTLHGMTTEGLITHLAESKAGADLVKITDAIENDPDWADRLSVMAQEERIKAHPTTDEEAKLLEKYSREYLEEVSKRLDDEREWHKARLRRLPVEELHAEFREFWIERRGGDAAMAELRLKEHYYATRVCDGHKLPDGTWDHGGCDHSMRVWETEEEVRHLPSELRDLIDEKVGELNMRPRDAKNSHRPGSSSEPSPRPSQPEESTPSTPEETSSEPLGTSSKQSITP